MRIFILSCATLLCINGMTRADEQAVKSRIVSVGLFKNGLAVVKREVDVPGPGTYRMADVPEPIHGTYWVESNLPVETLVQTRATEVPADSVGGTLQEELAGKKVTVYFRGEKLTPLSGAVVPPPKPQPEEFPSTHLGMPAYTPRPEPSPMSRFIILKTAKGRAYVDPSDIAYYEAEGMNEKVTRRKPVLVLNVMGEGKPGKVQVSYLAYGLSWAPSYRVDVTDGKKLKLAQSAVIRNELAVLEDTEVTLITGFPSVQFANVTSPLSARTTWATFFQQLRQRGAYDADSMSNVVSQQAVAYNRQPSGPVLGPATAGEGIDLHYQSIGKRKLGLGDSLALTTASGEADYQRIVEWFIPDNRDEFGRAVQQGNRGRDEDKQDDVWDALKFKNPLTFPMTTAPAMVVAGGKFGGQRLSTWANVGEETTLRVNKALSLRTRCLEHEEHKGNGVSERDVIYLGGQRFRKASVEGELLVCNHRQETVTLVIRRRFSGDLQKASDKPKVELREEGVYAFNKRNELVWTITLKPGEEKTLSYQYTVLINF